MAVPSTYINDYTRLFDTMRINPDKIPLIDNAASRITKNKDRYTAIQKQTGVPWFFIGLIHNLEANNDFTKHLHNGDPLTAKTKNVPAGRPTTGTAPFTFEQSAIDALKLKKFDKWTDWSIPGMLYQLELFNGIGYRRYRGINSPYLWSFSNQYTKGKYVADGKYDANAVSKQAGAAVILRRVLEQNNLYKAGGGLMGFLTVAAGFFFYSVTIIL